MAVLAVLKTLTPASASPKKRKRRFNKMMPNTFKRILSAVMALVLMVALLPAVAVTAEAAGTADAAIFFSDLHGQNPVNYENESDPNATAYKTAFLTSVMTALKGTGLPFSSVTSVGDAFSVNGDDEYNYVNYKRVYNGKYTGYTSIYTNTIQNVINVPVNYAWSDHDRYAVELDGTTLLNKTSHLAYSGNYYVYVLSMADISTEDRYTAGFETNRAANGFTESVSKAIENFQTTVAGLDKTKPLFITSHQPLLENRGDNNNAYAWYQAITEVAEEMDVIFLHGHNHNHDKSDEYYYAKGDKMNVAGDNSSKELPLNFTHLVTGYLDPGTTGSTSNTTRTGTVIAATITDDSIQLTTYCATGKYTGNYAVDESVTRDHDHKHDYVVSCTATCTEDGYEVYTCSICGDSYNGEFVEAFGHFYDISFKDPTCSEAGAVIYTCCDCQDSYSEEIPALSHEYKAVVTEATCHEAGYTTYTCTSCGHSYKETTGTTLEHQYNISVVNPTCTKPGHTNHICRNCGDAYITDEVAALGHKYNSTYNAPTCLKSGGTLYTCSVCKHSYTEIESALGHSYVTETVEPTCSKAGYTLHTCSTCGAYYKDQTVAAGGHNNEITVVEPTCTTYGMVRHTCVDCGLITVSESTPPLGHCIYTEVDGGSVVYKCEFCDYSFTETFALKRSTVLTSGDKYVITLYSSNNYYALSHKRNRLAAVKVTVSNNQITSEVTDDLLWDYSNKVLSYTANGRTYKLYASSASAWSTPTLSLSTSNTTNVTLTSKKLKVGNYYLRYASNKISLNSSASTAYLFKQVTD